MKMLAKLFLKRGKEKPVLHRHPWIFSGAIARVENASDGDTVDVYDAGGQWLAKAAFNSRSQIAARVWTFQRDVEIDREFFHDKIMQAIGLRESLVTIENPHAAYRIANAESDGLPGIVVDRYGHYVIAQFLTLGAELHKDKISEILFEQFEPRGVYERSDVDVRMKEGMGEITGVLKGDEPPERIEIDENGLHFLVDVKHGHKTGFYLDQRTNRWRVAPYLSGAVLNAFAYTGAFGVYALQENDARVVNLDTSASSLELAHENFALNHNHSEIEFVVGDAFEKLREYRAEGRKFDSIVLDPPKFVTSRANLDRATRGYKDINMLALQLLNVGGFLVTFSCSGLVSPDLFQKIVFGAALDAKRDAQIVEKLGQAPDHPIGLNFPEGEYLKGLILRVE